MIESIPQFFDAEHSKTLSFVKALKSTKNFGITNFELESDTLCVINRINSRSKGLSMIVDLTKGIRELLKEFKSVKVCHVNTRNSIGQLTKQLN